MKLLVINWNDLTNPFAGGAEIQLHELLKRLVSYGHEVTLVCSNFSEGKSIDCVNGINIIRKGNRYNFNIIIPGYLKKLVKTTKFDIVISASATFIWNSHIQRNKFSDW